MCRGSGISIISFPSFRFGRHEAGLLHPVMWSRIPVMWGGVPVDVVHRNGSWLAWGNAGAAVPLQPLTFELGRPQANVLPVGLRRLGLTDFVNQSNEVAETGNRH
jgi:hypothetical protein